MSTFSFSSHHKYVLLYKEVTFDFRLKCSSMPGRVIPNTLKMVVMSALIGDQGCGVSITADWLVSGK